MKNPVILSTDLAEAIRRSHKRIGDAGFGCCVSCVSNDFEFRLRPRSMQIPGAHDGTHDVVTTMDDHAGNVSNAIDMFDQVVVSFKETVVHEVVTLDTCDCKCLVRFGEIID